MANSAPVVLTDRDAQQLLQDFLARGNHGRFCGVPGLVAHWEACPASDTLEWRLVNFITPFVGAHANRDWLRRNGFVLTRAETAEVAYLDDASFHIMLQLCGGYWLEKRASNGIFLWSSLEAAFSYNDFVKSYQPTRSWIYFKRR
eukprot:gnl/Spiro4/20915_TR10180_c0_g1_i1.p1 gnl/Spiro4/20915_TR10180_c0_g1~~gnl/Spiro4/20915_TR10180_c0_g1_i1.p1  ORF type:complete len:166 (+),score=42.62 gnl/Spiro4/20915_TR10180_c0_g1_i1:65-499(+)